MRSYIQHFWQSASLAFGLTIVLASTANAQTETVLWQLDDPDFPTGLIVVTPVDATTITGQPGIADGHATIGQAAFSGTQKFVNINSGFLEFGTEEGQFDPALIGTDFSFTMDYYVPTDTNMDALGDGGSPDNFWLQIGFNGVNSGSNGFINNSAAGNGWNTLSLTGTIPTEVGTPAMPTLDVQALLVAADGGFGSGVPNGDGTGVAFYIDNLLLVAGITDSIPGDFNDDGFVNTLDVDMVSSRIGQEAFVFPNMDLDEDGFITLADHDMHIETLVMDANGTGAIIGDLNLDGDVDVSQIAVVDGMVVNSGDASVLLASLGETTGQLYADGDLNGDGDVDVSQIEVVDGMVVNSGDASILLANLGMSTSPGTTASAVPEPGSLAVFAIAGLGAVIRRRR